MTTALKRAIAKLKKMSISEQDAIAQLLMNELSNQKFAIPANKLEILALEAISEFKQKKCQNLLL